MPADPTNDAGPPGRFPLVRARMRGRRIDEAHRVSSPLELLFDLTFVVAIGQVSAQFAHGIAAGGGAAELLPFSMVFFAIWWAWMNFTWFASAYDTDDVAYRLFTLVQMAGVLVLAAGVPSAFTTENFVAITVGYLIMRVGLVAQWVRAAIENPAGRTTALRYAIGISVVQVGWVSRLALPPEAGGWSFIVLAAADLSVPLWAERPGMSAWHPHHIAERFGLFAIIVLGESVASATVGVQDVLGSAGVSAELVTIAAASLVLLFALWWLYFLQPYGSGLAARRSRAFAWGYGHYFVFGSLAALGAGLEVAVERGSGHAQISELGAGYAIAVPVALDLVLLILLGSVLDAKLVIRPLASAIAAVVVLALPLSVGAIGLGLLVTAIAAVVAALIAFAIVDRSRPATQNGPPPVR